MRYCFLFLLSEVAKRFQVRNLYKTRKSTKNLWSNFGLIEGIMDLSRILLAVSTQAMQTFNVVYKHTYLIPMPFMYYRPRTAGDEGSSKKIVYQTWLSTGL